MREEAIRPVLTSAAADPPLRHRLHSNLRPHVDTASAAHPPALPTSTNNQPTYKKGLAPIGAQPARLAVARLSDDACDCSSCEGGGNGSARLPAATPEGQGDGALGAEATCPPCPKDGEQPKCPDPPECPKAAAGAAPAGGGTELKQVRWAQAGERLVLIRAACARAACCLCRVPNRGRLKATLASRSLPSLPPPTLFCSHSALPCLRTSLAPPRSTRRTS